MTGDMHPTSLVSQKQAKCRKFHRDGDLPICYTENTPKEQVILGHVKDYERQFKLVYREHAHRNLLLYPLNECEV